MLGSSPITSDAPVLLVLTGVLTSRKTLERFTKPKPYRERVDGDFLSKLLDQREKKLIKRTTIDKALEKIRTAAQSPQKAWWVSLKVLTNSWDSLAVEGRALVAPRFPVELLRPRGLPKDLPRDIQDIPSLDLHVHLGWSVDFHVIWLAVMAGAVWSGGWRTIDEQGNDWEKKQFPAKRIRLSKLVAKCREAIEQAGVDGPRERLKVLKEAWGDKSDEIKAIQEARKAMENWLSKALHPSSEEVLRKALRTYVINAGVCRRALLSYRERQGLGLDPFRQVFERANYYRNLSLCRTFRKAVLLRQRPAQEWRHEALLLQAASQASKLRWERRLLRICLASAHERKREMDGIEVRASFDPPAALVARQARALASAVVDFDELHPNANLHAGLIVSLMKGKRKAKRQKIVKDAKDVAKALVQLFHSEPRWSLLIRGVDAAGGEIGSKPREFVPAFQAIDAWNQNPRHGGHQIRRTFHAGEDFRCLKDGLLYIDKAIDELKLRCGDRLGHASALGSRHNTPLRPLWNRVRNKLRRKEIVVESCPTSNLVTRQLSSFKTVPFWRLAKAGITVTINTDNPGLLATSWHEEVMRLLEARRDRCSHNLVRAAVNNAPSSSFLLEENMVPKLTGILRDLLARRRHEVLAGQ